LLIDELKNIKVNNFLLNKSLEFLEWKLKWLEWVLRSVSGVSTHMNEGRGGGMAGAPPPLGGYPPLL
jgi:hypothetical protein